MKAGLACRFACCAMTSPEGQTAAPKLKNAPVVLAILDGWGQAPKGPGNALALALSPWRDTHTIFVLARKRRDAADA